jgi:hypothetical protein
MTLASTIAAMARRLAPKASGEAERAIALMRHQEYARDALVGTTDREAIPRITRAMAAAGVNVGMYELLDAAPRAEDMITMDCAIVPTSDAHRFPGSAELGDGLSIAWGDHDLREGQWRRFSETYRFAGVEAH